MVRTVGTVGNSPYTTNQTDAYNTVAPATTLSDSNGLTQSK